MQRKDLGPFLGAETAVNPRFGHPLRSADEQNVRHEDGQLIPRYGFRNFSAAAIPSWAASQGLAYVQGYNSSSAIVEEYLSFQRKTSDTAGKARVYSHNAATPGAGTEVENSGNPVQIFFGDYPTSTVPYTDMWAIPWQSDCYLVFPHASNSPALYKHTIGDATTLTPVQIPADPTVALGRLVGYNASLATQYDQLSWAGLDMNPANNEIVYTGRAVYSTGSYTGISTLNSDNTITIGHTSGTGAASVKIDLQAITAGVQDYSYSDARSYKLVEGRNGSSSFHIDPASIKTTLINSDGSPLTFTPATIGVRVGTNEINVFVYDGEKTRASWDNIRYIQFDYNIIAAAATTTTPTTPNCLTIGKVFLGCTFPARRMGNERLPGLERFGYSYYFSTPVWESGIAGTVDIPSSLLFGYNPLGSTGGGPLPTTPPEDGGFIDPGGNLGCFVKFTFTTSADSNVDFNRLYYYGTDGLWRLVVSQSDATPTYTMKMSQAELMNSTTYSSITAFTASNLIGGFPYRGSIVWLYKGGYQNIRVSRIGNPLKQSSTLDTSDNLDRGVTMSLADNYGDEPVGCGFQCENAMLIPGSLGIYASVGELPYLLTSPKRLPGSFGCPNIFAACRFNYNGQTGIAALSKNGEGVYFYSVSPSFEGDTGSSVEELTKPVRGSIASFLISPQVTGVFADKGTALAGARIFYEESTDALWLVMGMRAMVLRRPSLESGEREWEFYVYTGSAGTEWIKYVAQSTRRRTRWLRSTGAFDENEYNQTTASYIAGSTRDAGLAMPAAYWTSKITPGQRRRFMWAHVRKETAANTPSITVVTDEGTYGPYSVAASREFVKGLGNARGREMQFKITLNEGDGAVKRVEIYESEPIGDRRWA